MRQTLVLTRNSALGESSIFIFEQFFTCIDKIVSLGRRQDTRL